MTTDISTLPTDRQYIPSAELDATGQVYTAAELGALVDSHVAMGWDTAPMGLCLLSDGRVVDADWDPNAGEPTVIAEVV